ncbi:ATP-binding cassette domain-containing protein [Nonomuraea sp. NPDC049714]|uniref:ATP-binding cassette domain-containing protein n=1 Tax=Nonomuraea sp. NPDC049714 TaxID=3364357 RepID=UPI0037B33D24
MNTGELGSIRANGLVRKYRRPQRQPGLRGALRHLVKPSFEEVSAVAEIDLTIEPGESVGYVGANGAGKSTTIKMLTGVIEPTHGTVRVNGIDPARKRRQNAMHIGVVWGQRDQLWWDLPVRESFLALKAIYGIKSTRYNRILGRLVDLLEIGDILSAPVRQLSLGQRTRANICAALLHEPAVLFLDEPTIGLDIFIKERVRTVLREMQNQRSMTLVLTSHDLTDVERICDRLTMIDKGRLIFDGLLQSAIKEFARIRTLQVTTRQTADANLLIRLPNIEVEQPMATQLLVHFDEQAVQTAKLVSDVLANYDVIDLVIESPSIEDAIRQLTTNGLGEKSR